MSVYFKIMKRICLWSSPRNISTALMYSFAQRDDTAVFDEPLYAHYLRLSGSDHPGRQEIIDSMDPDGENVISNIILGEHTSEVLFFKQMTHHFIGLREDFLNDVINVFLIRDPKDLIISFSKVIADVNMERIGVKKQHELFQKLISMKQDPPVIDSGEILKDPEKVLTELCGKIGIPFDSKMLSWKPGPIPEDGVWAKHWYKNVHSSTGFSKFESNDTQLPEKFISLYEECMFYYNELKDFSIKAY